MVDIADFAMRRNSNDMFSNPLIYWWNNLQNFMLYFTYFTIILNDSASEPLAMRSTMRKFFFWQCLSSFSVIGIKKKTLFITFLAICYFKCQKFPYHLNKYQDFALRWSTSHLLAMSINQLFISPLLYLDNGYTLISFALRNIKQNNHKNNVRINSLRFRV